MTAALDWQRLKKRVAEAFGALREDGVNARGPIGFDQREALHKVVKPGRYRAYAFFHSQDSQRARSGGPLWVGFGCTKDPAKPAQAAAVGREVRDALIERGLFVEWNGKSTTRLAVHLSAKSAAEAKKRSTEAGTKRVAETRKLATVRLAPETFFASLREALEGLAKDGKYRVFFSQQLDYSRRSKEAALAKKTVIVCPSKFSPTWDKLNIDVTTYPVEHDKSVVKQIADALRKAGFKVAYIHGSYLHVRTTTAS